jgi:hypothetical protein
MAELRAPYSVLLDRKYPQQWVCDLCEFASLWAVVVLVVKSRELTGLLHKPHGFTLELEAALNTIELQRKIAQWSGVASSERVSVTTPMRTVLVFGRLVGCAAL